MTSNLNKRQVCGEIASQQGDGSVPSPLSPTLPQPHTARPRNYHARSGSGHDEAIQRAPWYGGGLHVCSHISAREWVARGPGEP
jgi:hypothetical protein